MTFRVLQPGLQSTVQDLGRYGHQGEGIPVSGAMDEVALRLANLVVGNAESCACLEVTLVGPALQLEADALIALGGTDLGAVLNDQPLPMWRCVFASAGSRIHFQGGSSGCRAYLAVAGGIDVPMVMGSRSTYLRASFGGHMGRALKNGDRLTCGRSSPLSERIAARLRRDQARTVTARWGAGPSLRPRYSTSPVVRVVPDAHTQVLDGASRQRMFDSAFRVSTQSDRMGYRLTDVALELSRPVELLSEGVTFGTIQLPPGGAPIVLMADRQTTGGYPRIGCVASVDLPLLAQLRPGDRVRFAPVSPEVAQALYLAREDEIAQLAHAIAFSHH